jgi:hypothetical protein
MEPRDSGPARATISGLIRFDLVNRSWQGSEHSAEFLELSLGIALAPTETANFRLAELAGNEAPLLLHRD